MTHYMSCPRFWPKLSEHLHTDTLQTWQQQLGLDPTVAHSSCLALYAAVEAYQVQFVHRSHTVNEIFHEAVRRLRLL